MISIPSESEIHSRFPIVGRLLPELKDIPKEFREGWHNKSNPWCKAATQWFFHGGTLQDFGIKPKENIDKKLAVQVLSICLSSFEPKHEHKIAGVGYLMSEWFDLIEPQLESSR